MHENSLSRSCEKYGRLISVMARCLLALLCLFPLSAAAQDITLDLWHAYRGDEATALQNVVNDFEKANPNIKVKVLPVPDESFQNKVFTGVPQGSGPDAFIAAHDVIGNWADNKIIADLTPYITESDLSAYHETTVKAVRYKPSTRKKEEAKEGIYAIPLAYKSVVLFYNKDLVPNPPKTTDELLKYLSYGHIALDNDILVDAHQRFHPRSDEKIVANGHFGGVNVVGEK